MSSNSILNAVQHYQRSIEKNPADVARLLHCVGKLYKIPITVEHLQQTGVGRTVNALRKHGGELGVAAEAVINKWKQLVAVESDIRAGNQSSENEQDVDGEGDDNNSEKTEQIKTQSGEHTATKPNPHHSVNKTHHEERSKSNSEHTKDTLKNHHKSGSSAHKLDRPSHHKSEHEDKSKGHHSSKDSHKKDEREHKSHKTHSRSDGKEKSKSDRENEKEKENEKHSKDEHKSKREILKPESSKKHSTSKEKSEHHSSHGKHKHHEKHQSSKDKDKSKLKSSSEHKAQKSLPTEMTPAEGEPSTSKKSSSSEKKRRHENDEKDKEHSPKKIKSSAQQNETQSKQKCDNEANLDDGIDSSMGANFADVLGMLNMPQKKAKKSLNALKSTSPKSSKQTPESQSPKGSSKINGVHNIEMPSTSSSSSSKSTSQRNLEKKPELLTSKAKLPPLDPSIALELPIISNNYKPLPLNPTVMDCVFNSTTSSSSRAPPPRLLSDAEALSHGISSKTMRTKVYSGVKTGQLLQVPSLFGLCVRVLQKNIDALEYTGGVPFDVLRPVLERATPQQLFTFEEYNPYVMEDSDVLWKQHVQRNYRAHKREEMESWREMFLRCQEDQERRLSMLAENIKQSQKAIALPVRKTQLAFVDSMVKPPRNVVRKQEQFGTKSRLVATPAARVEALCNVTPNAAKQGDARLRVAAAFAQDPVKLSNAPMRPKKAPLMAKTLQFMRGRLKR